MNFKTKLMWCVLRVAIIIWEKVDLCSGQKIYIDV